MLVMTIMSRSSSLALVLLCLFGLSLIEALNGGFSVEMIHRDSSRSPFYNSTETQFQRVANALRRSINRANHLNQFSVSPNTAMVSVIPYGGEYLMSYSVGTPPVQVFGIVDTGSDILWLQCQPCKACYKQTSPIFDSSKSTTYKTLPCSSNTCKAMHRTSCSSDKTGICEYGIGYADGSHSKGDLSVETLTLGSTNGSPIQFPSTVIGCGRDNAISFEGKNSGVVGLGGGPLSLTSQLSSSIGGKFSYCLLPMDSQSNLFSNLNFGDTALVSGSGTVSTPLVLRDIFYYLTLEAFSVENNRINFGGSSSGSGGEGNIIIDSGTTLTLLPNEFYSKLESAVASAVKLNRAKDPSQILSLCYQSTAQELNGKVPKITVHFRGADVYLNALNTFIQVADEVVCFAFKPIESGAIFGNLAQQNILVGYDLQKKTLSFQLKDCTQPIRY